MTTTINIAPSEDAFVDQQNPNNTHNDDKLVAGSTTAFLTVYYQETYLRFPLTSIPVYATITSAKLYLYNTYQANNSALISNIPVANRTWSEATITWNNKPAYTNTYPNIRAPGVATNAWSVTDITSYIIDQYNQGVAAEFTLSNIQCSGCQNQYKSKDNTDTAHRPYLQVIYTPLVTATNITLTPTSCTDPCTTVVSVTWQNNDTISHTLTPGITVDGTLYTLATITLAASASTTQSFNVSNLVAGNHIICPVPN